MPSTGVDWQHSSVSTDPSGRVEVALLPDGGAAVRDSSRPEVVLRFTRGEWDAFVGGARDGQFNSESA